MLMTILDLNGEIAAAKITPPPFPLRLVNIDEFTVTLKFTVAAGLVIHAHLLLTAIRQQPLAFACFGGLMADFGGDDDEDGDDGPTHFLAPELLPAAQPKTAHATPKNCLPCV